MGLFSKKKKSCCEVNVEKANETTDAKIKVLGTGCKKCVELERNTEEALKQLNIDEQIDHVTEVSQIAMYGVMSTPALVIHEKVVSYGKVLTVDELKDILEEEL
ncbi:thioredoxin family protein [Abyssicoccus albus]|uniref:Small redox-active disulfide protein 2 n=1 Tax=Abyssicoccus albus TaxID=1817405 RepID=A0A3N5CFF2_9BACL|nr:small redox-active disulfide protein 2 [Abyssicoccus albus]